MVRQRFLISPFCGFESHCPKQKFVTGLITSTFLRYDVVAYVGGSYAHTLGDYCISQETPHLLFFMASVVKLVNTAVLGTVSCGFESHPEYILFIAVFCFYESKVNTRCWCTFGCDFVDHVFRSCFEINFLFYLN